MSEQSRSEQAAPTGVARVDAVLETLGRLDELPLEQHVEVFEAAHGELRRALDSSPTGDAMARVAGAVQSADAAPTADG